MAGSFELISTIDNADVHKVDPLPTGGVTKGEVLAFGSGGGYGFVLATVGQSSISNSLDADEYAICLGAQEVEVNISGSESVTQGDLAYWDGTNVTASSTGNTLIGVFVQDATTAATKARIKFDGLASVL